MELNKRPKKERYYTKTDLTDLGMVRLKEHIIEYLSGNRTIPISKTKVNLPGIDDDLFLFYSPDLLRTFVEDNKRIIKPYEVAIKYGFRGHSKGGINGIFYLRKKDSNLKRKNKRMSQELADLVTAHLEISNMADLGAVKIVWHNPSGERIVGVYNQEKSRIFFTGFASY